MGRWGVKVEEGATPPGVVMGEGRKELNEGMRRERAPCATLR